MPGPGSTSNVIAALASFFVPGLGQLVQVIAANLIWVVSFGTLGWIVELWSVIDANILEGPTRLESWRHS